MGKPADIAVPPPVVAVDPAQANELAQARALLEADDTSKWGNAIERLQVLANKGDSEAMRLLGIAFQRGRGVTEDLNSSCTWYKKSADAGNTKAQSTYKDLKHVINDPKICP